MARQVDHLNSLGSAPASAAIASYFLDDARASRRYAAECVELVRGRGFHTLESSALVFRGWASVVLGDSGGTAQVEKGMALAESAGSGSLVQLCLTAADASLLVHDYDRTSAYFEGGAAALERTREYAAFAPQIRMLRAQMLLESGEGSQAEIREILLDSIERWRAFESQWMAIRSLSLLRGCAQGANEIEEARARLAEACDALPEAAVTTRVREARALLAQAPYS